MSQGFRFVSALAVDQTVQEALPFLTKQVEDQFGENPLTQPLDLVVVFFSSEYTQEARQIVEGLKCFLDARLLLGCTAEGVISRDREIESRPAISLVAACLPGVTLSPFILHPNDWPPLLLDPEEFRRAVNAPEDTRFFILLGDPFSAPVDDIVQAFNASYSGIPVIGGLASGALRQFGNALAVDDQVFNVGVVGVAVAGPIDADIIVSQGCRPIWQPFTVTEARKNKIFSLEGKAPLAWVQDLIPELPEEDRALLQNGLFVGRAIRSSPEPLGRGDFLVRGVIAIDRGNGSIEIGDSVMEGDIIQFHVRDPIMAQEDLEMMLIPQGFCEPPGGALLFCCNGRGTRMYDYPNGDITVIQRNLGGAPLAGFFCAGEIGPIGSENFRHGHTASLAIFRPVAQ